MFSHPSGCGVIVRLAVMGKACVAVPMIPPVGPPDPPRRPTGAFAERAVEAARIRTEPSAMAGRNERDVERVMRSPRDGRREADRNRRSRHARSRDRPGCLWIVMVEESPAEIS